MKYTLLIAVAFFAGACNNAAPVAQNAANTAATPGAERPQTMTAHSTEDRPAPASSNVSPAAPGKFAQGGEPIDTARFDGTIAEAEKIAKNKPNDEKARKDLAQAYFDRGAALTEARQYASALGDYRRALKADPSHEEAKNWVAEITRIYALLKKEPPKESEEPPPLPFKKVQDKQ